MANNKQDRPIMQDLQQVGVGKSKSIAHAAPYLARFKAHYKAIGSLALGMILFLTACAPTPESNVVGYWLARQLGTLTMQPKPSAEVDSGTITGTVVNGAGEPIAGATVLVATRTGTPYDTQTNTQGEYTLSGVPAGQYVPAAIAPGYEETVPQGWLGIPSLVTVTAGEITTLPPLTLHRHQATPLPTPLPSAVDLVETASHSATSPFPAGATAQVHAYSFEHAGTVVDSLRLYLPASLPADRQLPMLFMIYPTAVDGWESVSVAFADAGYAFVALSPMAAHAMDIDAHAQDARVALALARGGFLHPAISPDEVVVLGGSFSSPIMHRLLRDERAAVVAWVTVGGISNGFSGAADFYAGRLEMPPAYELLIPSLGAPNLYPLQFLRYSPIYTAAQLPPTLIIHTEVDKVTPIEQAYQLAAALQAADVPVKVFYYEDVSHYLQIGDDLTPAGQQMYNLILDFAQSYQSLQPLP
jgi:acetyl esterase/lipase